jgi:hypothetical protein
VRLFGEARLDGAPIEGAYVRLVGPSGDFAAEVRTNESGKFLFYPAEGEWTLRGQAAGGLRAEKRVMLLTGQTVEVVLDFSRERRRGADPESPAGSVSLASAS